MKSLQELLRELREDNDLTQSDIAALIGTTQQQYSNYEKGESETPLRTLSLLADRYNVSVDFLMGRTECRDGIAGLNRDVIKGRTVGTVVSDILSLGAAGRAAVLEQIYLQRIKIEYEAMKKKDGARP